jgi:heme exporter protein D
MEATNHLGFIVSSYAAAVIVCAVLIVWVMLDYRAQKRALADLDTRGLTRRSAALGSEQTMERAKEKA